MVVVVGAVVEKVEGGGDLPQPWERIRQGSRVAAAEPGALLEVEALESLLGRLAAAERR